MNTIFHRNSEIFIKLAERNLKIQPINDMNTGKFSENLINVNDWFCYILDDTDTEISDVVIEECDYIIAPGRSITNDFLIIPTEKLEKTDLQQFENCWHLLEQ